MVRLTNRKGSCVRDVWGVAVAQRLTMDYPLIMTTLEKATHICQIVAVAGGTTRGARAPFRSLLPGERVARQEGRHGVILVV